MYEGCLVCPLYPLLLPVNIQIHSESTALPFEGIDADKIRDLNNYTMKTNVCFFGNKMFRTFNKTKF